MCNSDNSSLHNLLIAKTRQKHNKYMKATRVDTTNSTHYTTTLTSVNYFSFFCSPLQRQKSACRLIWQPGGLGLSLSSTAPSNPSCPSFRSRPCRSFKSLQSVEKALSKLKLVQLNSSKLLGITSSEVT